MLIGACVVNGSCHGSASDFFRCQPNFALDDLGSVTKLGEIRRPNQADLFPPRSLGHPALAFVRRGFFLMAPVFRAAPIFRHWRIGCFPKKNPFPLGLHQQACFRQAKQSRQSKPIYNRQNNIDRRKPNEQRIVDRKNRPRIGRFAEAFDWTAESSIMWADPVAGDVHPRDVRHARRA